MWGTKRQELIRGAFSKDGTLAGKGLLFIMSLKERNKALGHGLP